MATRAEPRVGNPIVGTWRLTSFTEENLATRAVSYPFGRSGREHSSSTTLTDMLRRSSRQVIASRRSRPRRPSRRLSSLTAA